MKQVILILLAAIALTGCKTDWWDQLPTPIPTPQPDPTPAPDPDLDGVTWIYGRNISEWPMTIKLSNVGHNRKKVWMTYDRLQDIPAADNVPNPCNVNGSIWLIRWFKGVKYCGTFDYLRVGQMSKEFGASPEYQFDPKPGDKFGIMVSTMARAENGTVAKGVTYQERSNVFWLVW